MEGTVSSIIEFTVYAAGFIAAYFVSLRWA